MLEQIEFLLKHECGLTSGDKILVAVSGGPDSLCLLDLLWRLGHPLVVAHLDHAIRSEAIEDVQAVAAMAAERALPFVTDRFDVPAFAKSQKLSIEEAARGARYRFLFEQAEKFATQAVAVGHTADDQVETVLMHLLRGAGLAGLSGMSYRQLPSNWSQTIPLIRPLLDTWRTEVMAYLQARQLAAQIDSTNSDSRFYRNRLRLELVPYLETFHSQVRPNIARMAKIVRQDQTILEQLEEVAWAACVVSEGVDFIAFQKIRLAQQLPGMQMRLARKAIGRLLPNLRDIDFSTVQRFLEFLQNPPRSAECDLAAGLRLSQEVDLLWLARWQAVLPVQQWPQLEPGARLWLATPGSVDLPGGWRLEASLWEPSAQIHSQAAGNEDNFQAWLDAGALSLPLLVRTRQAGERFQPLGMAGNSLKLSDFWINQGLPRRARPGWPLVISDNQIAWIPGFRPAHFARLQASTDKICYLRLSKV